MAALITFEEAKRHLRIPPTTTYHDADITAKLEEASDIIHNVLKARDDPDWTPETVPRPIKHAVYLMLTHLFEHRGDDMSLDEKLWDAEERLLARLKCPTLA